MMTKFLVTYFGVILVLVLVRVLLSTKRLSRLGELFFGCWMFVVFYGLATANPYFLFGDGFLRLVITLFVVGCHAIVTMGFFLAHLYGVGRAIIAPDEAF